MPKVTIKHQHESFESLLRRFKKSVDKSGILQDLREKEYFETPSQRRKKAKAAAIKRWNKSLIDEANELTELRRGAKSP